MAVTCAEEVDVGGVEGPEIDVWVDFCARTGYYGVGFCGDELEVGVELVEAVDVGEGVARGLGSEVRTGGQELLEFRGAGNTGNEWIQEMFQVALNEKPGPFACCMEVY